MLHQLKKKINLLIINILKNYYINTFIFLFLKYRWCHVILSNKSYHFTNGFKGKGNTKLPKSKSKSKSKSFFFYINKRFFYSNIQYLNKKNKKKILNTLKVINYYGENQSKRGVKFSSDFETIIVNDIHYVYAIGLMYYVEDKSKNKKIEYKDFFIDFNTSMKDIEEQSYILIKNYLFFLLNFFTEKMYIYIYFHNLGSFDGMFIVKTINKYFSLLFKEILIRNNCIYKIVLRNIIFLDSFNLFNASLDKIGETFFNLKKLKIDFTKIKTIKDIKKNFNSIKKYLYRDIEILYKFINDWSDHMINVFNIDITINFTISSIALSYYRKFYLDKDVEIELTKGYKYHFIKKSYFGGLCNVLHTQCNDKGYYYDINSLYPSQMKSQYYPVGKSTFLYNCSVKDIEKYFGFIECLVYISDKITLPPLPFKIKNVISQPTGWIKWVWWSEELKNAIKLGVKVIKIYKVLHYDKKVKLFNHFITDIYNKRISSKNVLERSIYKSIMNSLYGRFGMDIYKYETLWTDNEDKVDILEDISDVKNYDHYEKNNMFTYQIKKDLFDVCVNTDISPSRRNKMIKEYELHLRKDEHVISCIQLASAISGYSRIKLVNDITDHINKNNAIVYYYDTDSIITNTRLNEDLLNEKEIGKYKLEYEFKRAIFLSPKIYFIEGKINTIKFKGLKKDEISKYTYYMFEHFLIKNNSYQINNRIKRFNKSYKDLNIHTREIKEMIIKFDSYKYEKIYDKNNVFIKTKPIKYNIFYTYIKDTWRRLIYNIKKWFN